ncbi:MAG: hypothetical protein Q4C84_04275 [Bacillota bacterium]|nr:hypothetical protein [Bacillota bacterium]
MKKSEHFKSNLKVLITAENEDLSNEFIIGGIILKGYIPAFVKMQKGIEAYYGSELENI